MVKSYISRNKWAQNSYYIQTRRGGSYLVDPGCPSGGFIDTFELHRLSGLTVLLTHGHHDHMMGLARLKNFSYEPVYLDEKDEFLAKLAPNFSKLMDGYMDFRIPKFLGFEALRSNDVEVLQTPGHTPGSCSLVFNEHACVFVGDLIFDGKVGRCDGPRACRETLLASIEEVISRFAGFTLYPGHGPSMNVDDLCISDIEKWPEYREFGWESI